MPNDDVFKQDVNDWLDANWNPDRSLREWRELLVDSGWASPSWPKEYLGLGFNEIQAESVEEIFFERAVVGAAKAGSRHLAAETILVHGTEEQKRKYLRPILTGEHFWCQLFSEPGSGSDLAGASTKAEKVDGRWIINGQKVWTTSAHHADFGLLVARTNWDVPKHQGLSYFLFDMHQPGVEVRPLKQMNGHSSFNEVFITDAVAHDSDLLGEEGEGWRIAGTTLSKERRLGRFKDRSGEWFRGLEGRIYEEYLAEIDEEMEPYKWYPQRWGRVELALPRAVESGAIHDPSVVQEIGRLLCLSEAAELAKISVEQKQRAGLNQIIPEGSVQKLASSVISRQAAHVHTLISGSRAMLSGPIAEPDGLVAEILTSVPAHSIAGGTDQIQRNILAERVLGMPKEPRADTGPFRDVPRNVFDL